MKRALPIAMLVVLGCGHKPPPPKTAAELPVGGAASIAGDWVADDDMGWYYALSIGADGRLTRSIDRGKMPRCDELGTLTGKERKLSLALTKNTCHPDATGPVVVEIASFTGDALVIVVGDERRTYHRKPAQ